MVISLGKFRLVDFGDLTWNKEHDLACPNNLIGKIEYRYYDFGKYDRGGNPLTPNGQLPYTVDNTYSVVTLGLDYKFGAGAILAKY